MIRKITGPLIMKLLQGGRKAKAEMTSRNRKLPVNDNDKAGGNQSNAGNGGQTTDSPKDNVSNPQPASVAYSPQKCCVTCNSKVSGRRDDYHTENLQNHLNDSSITQGKEYNEYYPYDGMEGSYYSVFVETDLNKASTIDGHCGYHLRMQSQIYCKYVTFWKQIRYSTSVMMEFTRQAVQTYYEFRCHR